MEQANFTGSGGGEGKGEEEEDDDVPELVGDFDEPSKTEAKVRPPFPFPSAPTQPTLPPPRWRRRRRRRRRTSSPPSSPSPTAPT